MTAIRQDQLLVPSVLDRLIDQDPDVSQEPARNHNQLLRDLKSAVRRDLECLLNTRVRCVLYAAELKELNQSLVNYGIRDLTGLAVSAPKEREEFRRGIEAVILQFEPRLKNLSVQLVDPRETAERTIRFHIEAVLQAEPAPEPIAFDSTVRLTTGTFEVKAESNV
jgi:type VI secretion system protein ImpF